MPERVKVFLWFVVSQVIMTNAKRQRRHLSGSGMCQVCKGGEETIIHILRDCPVIAGIWNRIVTPSKRGGFFNQTLFEWIYTNLRDVGVKDEVPWATMFGMVL